MAETPLPLALPASRWKAALKIGFGRAWLALNPALESKLLAGDFVLPLPETQRCTLLALARRAERDGQPERMLGVHRRFWADDTAGPQHLAEHDWRYRDMFLNSHVQIVPQLAAAMAAGGVTRLVEVGCGHGEVLQHLARELPASVTELVGLDLSNRMVAENAERNTDPRVRFVCADASNWVLADAALSPLASAWFSYGGVLEYLSRAEVLAIFSAIACRGDGSVVALVEPLASEHQLEVQRESIPYGMEQSLSHNYPALVGEAGLVEVWREEVVTAGQRWLLLVACTATADAVRG